MWGIDGHHSIEKSIVRLETPGFRLDKRRASKHMACLLVYHFQRAVQIGSTVAQVCSYT